jgi:hypothetical protein
MSKPSFMHRVFFYLCLILVLFIGGALAIDMFTVGIRVMLFGAKMSLAIVALVILAIAGAYTAWHLGRFFKKG